jgi:hypothetical protein
MQDLKNDVVARGGFFEYFGNEEIAFIQIGVRILKIDEDTELACRSEFARYLRDDEILELSGMPRVTRNKDIYSAARITINLDTDEILLDRDVSGTLITEDEEEPAAGEPAAEPGTEDASPEADVPTGEPALDGGLPEDAPGEDTGTAVDSAATDTPPDEPTETEPAE